MNILQGSILLVLCTLVRSSYVDEAFPKGGKCPAESDTGICVHECEADGACPGLQKCCRNSCGLVCTAPVCDTSQEGFSEETPVAMMSNGKCPPGSRTQSFVDGQRLCCTYDWSMSDEPACPVEFTEPVDASGCSRVSGTCPDGYSCQHAANDGWHTCCRDEAPASCEDLDIGCTDGQYCELDPVQCVTTPCDPVPTCKDCDIACTADLICPYGRKTNENGCEICECNPTPFYCTGITCEDGMICKRVDRTGIQCDCPAEGECECPDIFESICVPINPGSEICGNSPPVCDDRCETGYSVDDRGCDRCLHCNPISVCPALECDLACANGMAWAVDGNGCRMCECYTAAMECPLPNCVPCENPTGKYDYDANGCRGCDCVSTVSCPNSDCMCPEGTKKDLDINGCETCTCVPEDTCGPVCEIYCEYGMVQDEFGCPICQCWEPHPCRTVSCTQSEHWCKTVLSAENAVTAKCLPVFPEPDCGDVICTLHCEYGYMYDERGCQLCQCDPYAFPQVGDSAMGMTSHLMMLILPLIICVVF